MDVFSNERAVRRCETLFPAVFQLPVCQAPAARHPAVAASQFPTTGPLGKDGRARPTHLAEVEPVPEHVRREGRVERSRERSSVRDNHLLDHAQLVRRHSPQACPLEVVRQKTHLVSVYGIIVVAVVVEAVAGGLLVVSGTHADKAKKVKKQSCRDLEKKKYPVSERVSCRAAVVPHATRKERGIQICSISILFKKRGGGGGFDGLLRTTPTTKLN